MNNLMQRLANAVGATEPVNGSWIFALLPDNPSTNIWQSIAELNGWTLVNGSWIQGIAYGVGATEPVNGSWLEAIVIVIENLEPEED